MRSVTGIVALGMLVAACGGEKDGDATDGGARDARVDLGGRESGVPLDDSGTPTDGGGSDDMAVALDMTVEPDASPPADSSVEPPPPDAGPAPRDRFMYVSVGGESRLAVLTLGADGSMTLHGDRGLRLPANPGPMAYARSSGRLYVGMGRNIATVAVDGTGGLSLLGQTGGLADSPVYVAVARDDSLIVTAYFGADELRVHDATGMPPHAERDVVDTADEPHCALVGPAGRVFVPHRNGNTTRWLDLSAAGELTGGGELAAEPGVGPRHIAFSPDGRYGYVVNEYADSVSAHHVADDGSLERFQTITTLPGDFDGARNTCADVHVTPDGRFVYASNRGHDSIAMFAIGADGSLSALGTVPTEARPREMEVSPDGRFVVAAGQDSGGLQSYRVEADGRLTSLMRLDVGDELLWVIID